MIGVHRTCCCDLTADFVMPDVDPPGSPTGDLDYAFWTPRDSATDPPTALHAGPMCLAVGYPLEFTGSFFPRATGWPTPTCETLYPVNFQLIFNPSGMISRTYSNFVQNGYLYFPFMIRQDQRPWRPCASGTQYQPECSSSFFRYPLTWCNNYVDYGEEYVGYGKFGYDDNCLGNTSPLLQWHPTGWTSLERSQLLSEGLGSVWDTIEGESQQAIADERNYRMQEFGCGFQTYALPGLSMVQRAWTFIGSGWWGFSYGHTHTYASSRYAPRYLIKYSNHPDFGNGYLISEENHAWPIDPGDPGDTPSGAPCSIIRTVDTMADNDIPLSCSDFHDKVFSTTNSPPFTTDFVIAEATASPKIKTIESFPGFDYNLNHPRMGNFFLDFLPRLSDFQAVVPGYVNSSLFSAPLYCYYGEIDCNNDPCWT